MVRRRWVAAAAAALSTGCAGGAVREVAAPEPDPVTRAIRYVEHRTNNQPRVIPPGGQEFSGIDINSSVRIDVDEDELKKALSAPEGGQSEAAALLERIAALKDATEAIPDLKAALQAALAEWDAAVASGNYQAVLSLIRRMAALEERVVAPLDAAIQARLRGAGKSPDQVRRESQEIRQRLRAFGTGGYGWDRLGQQLGLELQLLGAELTSRKPQGALAIEIQAHRLGKDGAVAIALPGYNQEALGPAVAFEKVQFAVPAAEQQLYERNAALAASVGKTVSFAQGLRLSLEAEFEGERAAIEATVAAARELFTTAESELQRIADQVADGRLEAWLESVRQTLEASPEGQAALGLGFQLAGLLAEFRVELQVLERYALLGPTITSMTPQQAVAAIAQAARGSSALVRHRVLNPDVWRRRATVMEQFGGAVRALRDPALRAAVAAPNGPVAVLGPAATKIGAATGRLAAAASTALDWLDNLASSTPALATTNLPIPSGQQRIALAERQADTEFDLQTIRAGRDLNDRVVVTVRFYRDTIPLTLQASRRFQIQSYGWNARFIASLAWLTRQGSDWAFRAAPAMSWMARYRKWPKGEDHGLGRDLVGGIGL
ncbi:MAG: hypothetical protein HYV20_14690, partial [Gemmatimonadetes bacterium]|nr:hypothetical protein [Gemmatimonadota bacterium]